MNDQSAQPPVSRRQLIKYGGGLIGTSFMATVLTNEVMKPQPVLGQNKGTPDEALTALMAGNQRFVNNKQKNPNQTVVRLPEVVSGQNPFAAVLSCADSRVPVEIIFDRGIGDIFVVRDAGNVATEGAIASLEFGTLVLGAKVLMVIGHQDCGAVISTMKQAEVPGNIGLILDNIKPAISNYIGKDTEEEAIQKATEANVLYQVQQLNQSPILAQLKAENKLKIVGAYSNLETGKITLL
ncbi:beta-carbonic anhydrase, periplasmic [Crocosphaera subtropica ATCC 51142]|uniref:carbonic anhydrase n=1 Tax=Crocosphaera subtropica (strain ATCC 51142 / BH68) TaxID=43989 RepID=B1WS28_CROS5|nr:carbonic anhydrase [Crocosphaera subtropica]ACB50222.1 beta-carbonic anhydrase, periplasmic [Crocosphaera subtropica ATCC 51142]